MGDVGVFVDRRPSSLVLGSSSIAPHTHTPMFFVLGPWSFVLGARAHTRAPCHIPHPVFVRPPESRIYPEVTEEDLSSLARCSAPRPRQPLRLCASCLPDVFSRRGAEARRIILPEIARRSALPGQPTYSCSCSWSEDDRRRTKDHLPAVLAHRRCRRTNQGPRTKDQGPRTKNMSVWVSGGVGSE
jgi:hypothetical protein